MIGFELRSRFVITDVENSKRFLKREMNESAGSIVAVDLIQNATAIVLDDRFSREKFFQNVSATRAVNAAETSARVGDFFGA